MINFGKYTIRDFTFCLIFSLYFSLAGHSQIGIATMNPQTALDINGSLSLREGPALVLVNGANTTILLDEFGTVYSHYRIIGPTSTFGIRTLSVTAPSTLADGQLLTLLNTTDQKAIILNELDPLIEGQILNPGTSDIVLAGQNSTITFQYNKTKAKWIVIGFSDDAFYPSIDSVSLSNENNSPTFINSSTYTNISGMTLEFIARKSSVMVSLSASGNGEINSLSSVFLRILDDSTSDPATVLGGTNTNMQSQYSNYSILVAGVLGSGILESIANWSASFKKPLNNLVVGQKYTLRVEGKVEGEFGDYKATINPYSTTDENHLTLSVIQ